jgi:hypothetical protein
LLSSLKGRIPEELILVIDDALKPSNFEDCDQFCVQMEKEYYQKHPIHALYNSPTKIGLWAFAGLLGAAVVASQFVRVESKTKALEVVRNN